VQNTCEGHRLLISLAAVCIDIETTGLDVTTERIVSMAGLRLTGQRILRDERFDQFVNPRMPIPARSVAIHGITDDLVASAPEIADVLPDFDAFCGGRVIIGHNICFDLAVLRHEAARCQQNLRERPWLDTGLLALALNPALGDSGLESVAQWLGVTVKGRHTAKSDAAMAAEIFVRLIPRLRAAGVRTLAEARRFAETAAGALATQRAAGWFQSPSVATQTVLASKAPQSLERIDSFPYRHRIRDLMSTTPNYVAEQTSALEAARLMQKSRARPLIVGEPDATAGLGIVTERDLIRAIASRGSDALSQPVRELASYPLVCLREDAFVYQALGRMQRLRVRHLGVTGDGGRLVGVISARDLLEMRTTRAILIGDEIATAEDAIALAAAADEVPTMARALLAERVSALEVTAVISEVVREITTRAAILAERTLGLDGYGSAPVPWCLLILGSAGRGESLLSPDQDNAMVYQGDNEHDAWFAVLGERLVDILNEAGIPYCQGKVMANNPAWRRSLSSWKEEIERWVSLESDMAFQNINVFYDFEPVYGDMRLAAKLRDLATEAAGRHERTFIWMAHDVAQLRTPVGRFGRIELHEGRVDLKVGAVTPLVTAARALTLAQGGSARSTLDRFRVSTQGTLLSAEEAERLTDIYQLVIDLLLRQQLDDLQEGIPLSDRVEVQRLRREVAERLRAALKYLDKFLVAMPDICMRP